MNWFTNLFKFKRKYLYIFVRQDISLEQQAVQAAHATFVAGKRCCDRFNPDKTYFVLIGVPNLAGLAGALTIARSCNIPTYPFYEGDMNDELTAFCAGILTKPEQRAVFQDYKLLTFPK